ncbi:MAG: hypothetical protein QXS18_04895, partial [Thermoplasmata archaeon]
IQQGQDNNKPSNPTVGDIYIATDTSQIYYCFTAGTWSLIPDSALQQIASSGKVNGSSLTGLANIPSSAGNIPLANLANAVDYVDSQAGSNQAGKIYSLDEKTSLVDNDLFLIEDSESSYAKKKVKKSNIVSSGFVLIDTKDLSGVTSFSFSIPTTLTDYRIIVVGLQNSSNSNYYLKTNGGTSTSYAYVVQSLELGYMYLNSTSADKIYLIHTNYPCVAGYKFFMDIYLSNRYSSTTTFVNAECFYERVYSTDRTGMMVSMGLNNGTASLDSVYIYCTAGTMNIKAYLYKLI